MLPGARRQGAADADQRQLARARERFLTAESVSPWQVRDTILASWQRSRELSVATDWPDISYAGDPELDTPLTRSALPVLSSLREALDDQPISVILTDAAGVVQVRLAADRYLDRHLDAIKLAPGFSYAEGAAGTNGIGTALESGRPTHVFGHEHYADGFAGLACAGSPIRHPVTGRVVGLVDLTCWRRDADSLLGVLSQTTANQVSAALLADATRQERQLLQEYARACRAAGAIVLGLSPGTVLLNELARRVLDPADQHALLGQAAEALERGHTSPVQVVLPTGARVRLYCRPLAGSTGAAGVVQVRPADEPAVGPATLAAAVPVRRQRTLPGLVGSGTVWLHCCSQVDAAFAAGEWLVVSGEPGTGKSEVLQAVHRRHDPSGWLRVIDGARASGPDWLEAVRAELSARSGTLVLSHVDRLDQGRLDAVAAAIEQVAAAGGPGSLWVAMTTGAGQPPPELTRLLRFFPRAVEVPPLRHHIEDLHQLVPFLLGGLRPPGRLVCSAEAMKVLLRYSWPGNVEQLARVLRHVVQVRRSGVITPEDLPPECGTVSRRLLTPLQAMERDAIVRALREQSGSKARAAQALGMSRATIYRRIREYGIVLPAG